MKSPRKTYRQLKSDLVDVKHILTLAAALPKFLREPVTLQRSEKDIKQLLDTRVDSFVELARSRIYQDPGSPYGPLVKHAGCEFSDLQSHLHRHGLEATLAQLAAEGVYFTSDEYKGKTEVVRGGLSFRVSPRDFETSVSSAGFTTASSGSRRTATNPAS